MPSLLDVLSGIGSALDTYSGASSVRDLIAGENPWDQFVDPLNEEKRVSGRQMLEKHGLVGENTDQGWIPDLGDLGGFAAEALLDPTNLLGGAGLAKRLIGISKAKAANRGIEAANALSREQRAMGFMPEEVAKLTKIREPAQWRVVPGQENELRGLLRDAHTRDPLWHDNPEGHNIVLKGDPQQLLDFSMGSQKHHPIIDLEDFAIDPYLATARNRGLIEFAEGGPKKMYHGTTHAWEGAPDPTKWDEDALYGRGHYTTDNPIVAGGDDGYTGRGWTTAKPIHGEQDTLDQLWNRMEEAKKAGKLDDSTYNYLSVKNASLPRPGHWADIAFINDNSGIPVHDLFEPNPAYVKSHYIDSRKPFDVEDTFKWNDLPHTVKRDVTEAAFLEDSPNSTLLEIRDAADRRNTIRNRLSQLKDPSTSDRLRKIAKQDITDLFPLRHPPPDTTLSGDDLLYLLKSNDHLHDLGYDSIRHTGGAITGGVPHNVVIALDPKNVYLPYIAKELQDLQHVASPNSLLATLAGYNALAHSDLETY